MLQRVAVLRVVPLVVDAVPDPCVNEPFSTNSSPDPEPVTEADAVWLLNDPPEIVHTPFVNDTAPWFVTAVDESELNPIPLVEIDPVLEFVTTPFRLRPPPFALSDWMVPLSVRVPLDWV